MENEELLVRRIRDLASAADRRGCITYTDFLNLNEQNILHQTLQKFSWIQGETFGGYEGAERQMAALIPADIRAQSGAAEYFSAAGGQKEAVIRKHSDGCTARRTEQSEEGGRVLQDEMCRVSPSGIVYPVACIRLRPHAPKFAEDFSHRDILGALMHLGIDRAKTGDIALTEDGAVLFCASSMAELICRELVRVRRTQVDCTLCQDKSFLFTLRTETVRGSIASVRLDAVMALGFGASRSSLLSLIESGSVFVNGKQITGNAYVPAEGDIVSARGLGRFRFLGVTGQTKKGRCMAEAERFL